MNQSLAHEDAAVIGGIFVMLGTHSPTCSIKRVPVIANHSDIAGNRTQTNKHLESEQWKWSRRLTCNFPANPAEWRIWNLVMVHAKEHYSDMVKRVSRKQLTRAQKPYIMQVNESALKQPPYIDYYEYYE